MWNRKALAFLVRMNLHPYESDVEELEALLKEAHAAGKREGIEAAAQRCERTHAAYWGEEMARRIRALL